MGLPLAVSHLAGWGGKCHLPNLFIYFVTTWNLKSSSPGTPSHHSHSFVGPWDQIFPYLLLQCGPRPPLLFSLGYPVRIPHGFISGVQFLSFFKLILSHEIENILSLFHHLGTLSISNSKPPRCPWGSLELPVAQEAPPGPLSGRARRRPRNPRDYLLMLLSHFRFHLEYLSVFLSLDFFNLLIFFQKYIYKLLING